MTHIGGQKMIGEYVAMVIYDAMFDQRCQIRLVASEALIAIPCVALVHTKVSSITTVKQCSAAIRHLFD
ncbi:hypothetical protein WT01_32250 [Burkholderia cepacia]|uniref:hypothetical protein n=1 Tax=Burkholderia cepacia TaxID=292 RepID=UPI000757931A|nr:hypothetical protein [Burkholderia cepacia]KVL49664.1 hypothetical protein WT01_32250 [Burkholderia cepacia]